MDINQLTAVKIKEIRLALGYKSEVVATQLGMSKASYSQLENGKTEISISRLNLISKIFKLPLTSFIPTNNSGVQVNNDSSNNNFLNSTQINNNDPKIIEVLQLTIQNLNAIILKLGV